MDINKEHLSRLKEIVNGSPRRMVIVTHTNPDGDAIGSSLTWAEILRSRGHEVTCIAPNKFPYFLDWMPGIKDLGIFKEDKEGKLAARIEEAEVIFCLDFNMIQRLEGLSDAIKANDRAVFVLIDHHLDPPADYDIVFSHPECSSTSYLIYCLIEELYTTAVITKEMGECLYVGMMTDTGNFAFSNLTSNLFCAVAELVRKGVDVAHIHTLVYNSFTVDRVKLLGYALNKMETMKAGDAGIAFITLRESELRRFRFQQGDSEGFVNYPLTVRDLDMSAIFIETRQFIRVSLRSRGDVDVSLFARLYFEGGGHRNASGGKSYRSMPASVEYFRKCVVDFFQNGGKDRVL